VFHLNELFNVSPSPHTRSLTSTNVVMQDVAIALIPASIFGVYNFGIHALLILLACIGTCIVTEYIYEKAMKKRVTIGDFSAVVTGLLLGLNMPPAIPLWIPILGSVFAIIVVKMLFGGLGQNFMNPALAARCFLLISFAGRMNNFAVNSGAMAIDGVSGATPLAALKAGETIDLFDKFLGSTAGTIGETSIAAILIGGIYLLVRKVINIRIPLSYIASFAVFMILFGGKGFDFNFVMAHVLSGGLMLGAFFMATDYVTSPITVKGQIVFGILLGLLTSLFRTFGASPEGVSYAIIISNMLVPLIENLTLPKAFGKETKAHE
jgi:Na+-translocating ferredoxin:NAD+ oxidoreductase subunit D